MEDAILKSLDEYLSSEKSANWRSVIAYLKEKVIKDSSFKLNKYMLQKAFRPTFDQVEQDLS